MIIWLVYKGRFCYNKKVNNQQFQELIKQFMTLTWYGLSSFKITTIGGGTTVITDPFAKDSGLTPPRGAADIVLISKNDELHSNTDGITGQPLVVRNPGEFDFKGVHIRGIGKEGFGAQNPWGEKKEEENSLPNTIYQMEVDGVRLGFLGTFGQRELSDHQLEELGTVDILLVPVGGNHGVINWEWASHIVQQVEPSFVVPYYFKQKGLIFDLDAPDKFLKEVGGKTQTEDRLTIKPKYAGGENTAVVVLNPQR